MKQPFNKKGTKKPNVKTWVVSTRKESLDSLEMQKATLEMVNDILGLARFMGSVEITQNFSKIGVVHVKCTDEFIERVQALPTVGDVRIAPPHARFPYRFPPKGPKT